jgi:hypothetical protein
MCMRIIVAAAWLLGSSLAFGDNLMRCDAAIVRVGMFAGEVIAKCGEPKSKQVEQVPVRARNRNGGSNIVGATTIETWSYDRGYGRFPALLKFEEGKLKSIELLTGG